MNNKWQVCPLCNGTGQIITSGSCTNPFTICDICNGEKIIDTNYGKPPSLQPTIINNNLETNIDEYIIFTPGKVFIRHGSNCIIDNFPSKNYINKDNSYTIPFTRLTYTGVHNGIFHFECSNNEKDLNLGDVENSSDEIITDNSLITEKIIDKIFDSSFNDGRKRRGTVGICSCNKNNKWRVNTTSDYIGKTIKTIKELNAFLKNNGVPFDFTKLKGYTTLNT